MPRAEHASSTTEADVDETPRSLPDQSGPDATTTVTGRPLQDGLLGLIVLGAAAVRFWAIGSPSLWFDEYITRSVVESRLVDLWDTVWNTEGTPPLYFLFEWAWVRVVGRGDAAMRSSSALVGTLTVVVVYALLLELGQSRRAARLAAVLIAVNPFLVWYSREVRSYALLAFLAACSLWCLARALTRRRPIDHALWSVVAAATFATHYFGVFLLVPQGAWLLARLWKERRWRDALPAFAPISVAGVALTLMAVGQRSSNQDWIKEVPISTRLAETGRTFVVGASQPSDLLLLVAIPPLIYAAVAIVLWAGRRERAVASGMVAVAAATTVLSLALAHHYFLGRSSIGVVVALTVPLAIGLAVDRARFGRLAAAGLCALWLLVIVWVEIDPTYGKPDWKGLAHAIEGDTGTEDRVAVLSLMALPMQRYGFEGARMVAPGEKVPVQEIDLIYSYPDEPRCAPWIGLACDFYTWPAELPPDLARQFDLVDEFVVDDFRVERFRSAEPVRIEPCRLIPRPTCDFVLSTTT